MQIAESQGHFLGIDGCRAGWLAVMASRRSSALQAAVFPSLQAIGSAWGSRLAPDVAIVIDMVLGLPGDGQPVRGCDLAARKRLGRGAASRVFPAPSRAALEVWRRGGDYAQGLAANRACTGKGLSIQAWHLLPKISEFDAAWGRGTLWAPHAVEGHPEVAFAALAGGAGLPRKHTRDGLLCRWEVLEAWDPCRARLARRMWSPARFRGAGEDDFLDALALLWRVLSGQLAPVSRLEFDAAGRPMAIWG